MKNSAVRSLVVKQGIIMTEKLTEDQVRQVAKLARLNCTEDEIAAFTRQLGEILNYVAQLEKLDTSGVEPLAHCLAIQNVFREDVVAASLSSDQALENAPRRRGGFFELPKVLTDTTE